MISAINNSLEAPVSASRRAHQSSNMKDKAGQVDTSTSEKIVKRIPCEGYVLRIADCRGSRVKFKKVGNYGGKIRMHLHISLNLRMRLL